MPLFLHCVPFCFPELCMSSFFCHGSVCSPFLWDAFFLFFPFPHVKVINVSSMKAFMIYSFSDSQPTRSVITVFSESFLILFQVLQRGRSCDFISVDLGNHSILSELSELKYPLNSKTLLSQILLSWNHNHVNQELLAIYILAMLIWFSSLFLN